MNEKEVEVEVRLNKANITHKRPTKGPNLLFNKKICWTFAADSLQLNVSNKTMGVGQWLWLSW